MLTDEDWMRVALEEADAAAAHGDVPVGAVLVDGRGTLLAKGNNRREIDRDPTAHAELVAMRRAAAELGRWRLDGATLYVTLEPCPMCAGALVNARVAKVVYGALDPKAGALDSLYELGRDARLNHRYPSHGGVLASACAERLREFFAERRARRTGDTAEEVPGSGRG